MPDSAIPGRAEGLLPLVLWITLVGSALVIAPGLLFYYDITPKIAVILFGTASVLVSHRKWTPGLAALLASTSGRWFLAALGLNAFSLAVSTVTAGDPALAFTGSEWRRLGLVAEIALLLWTTALAGWAAGSPARVVRTLRAIVVAGLAGALYGIAQYFGGDPFLRPEQYIVGEGYWAIVRPPGTLGHAGYFATFLLSGVFAGAAAAFVDNSRAWRALAVASAAMGSAAVVLSGTRSAIVGLLAGGIWLAIRLRPSIRIRHLALAAGLAAAAVAFYVSPPGQRLRARTRWYVEDAAGGGRMYLWRDSSKLGAGNWLAGAGLESFSAAFLPYQSLDLTLVSPDRYYESPHNVVLEAWASQGLPGLAAFLAMLTAAFLAIRSARQGSHERLVGCLFAGLLALLTSGMFLSFVAVTKLYFYVQIAMIVALTAVASPNPAAGGTPRWVAVPALGCAAAFAAFAMILLRADFLLQSVRESIPPKDPARTVELYRQFLETKPAGMYTGLWFSREMYVQAIANSDPQARETLWSAGKQAAEQALHESETPQSAAYSLAMYYAEEGNATKVEESLRAAAAAAPHWYKPYWMLAQVLDISGKREQALEPIRRAMELSGGQIEEVRATWERISAASKSPADSH